MSDERLARQWCDLLGWTWKRYGAPFERPGPWVSWRNDRAEVTIPHIDGARVYVVDLPTLATCALVRHAGPVDVGPCPECEGVRLWRDRYRSGYRTRDGALKFALTKRKRDGLPGRVAGSHGRFTVHWDEPCPACVVDGKPTGRRVVSAPEAVLMAAPEWCETCAGSGEPGNGAWVDWLDESSYDEPARRASPTECPDCRGHGFTPGPEGAREALRALTEGWREHLPVLADWMANGGHVANGGSECGACGDPLPPGAMCVPCSDWAQTSLCAPGERGLSAEFYDWSKRRPPADVSVGAWLQETPEAWTESARCQCVPRSLAECPAVARWVLAWLAGECPACGGRGANEYCERCSAPTDEVYGRVSSGRAIGPHLPAIYAHLTAAWEHETVECGCWPSALTGERRRWPDRGQLRKSSRSTESVPCERCAGLGRVRPEAQQEAACA